ncbi:MAG: VWA domain-containing protein [Acidobacteria bacterium]|nr:VWA domain-containing protein [Acidobacteriota bacterium]
MDFATKGLSKLEYAKFLAACLTYLAHRQRDRVGLVTFDSDVVDRVPVSAKHFEVVLHALDRATAGRPGHLVAPLRKLAEHFGRRGILVLISDLYEEPEAVLDAVKPLRFRGNDLIVFHVLDPAELEFPFDEPCAFEDLESGDRMPVVPQTLRAEYRQLVQQHIASLTAKFSEHRVDYALFDTSRPLDHALFSYLGARERLSRVR